MKNDRRGFTLVELMVVVAIMGILTGVMSLSVSTVSSARTKRCASEIDAYISMCKVNAMSRAADVKIVLYKDSDGNICGNYYEGDAVKSSEVFSDARVGVSYTVGADSKELDTAGLTLSFDRSSGAFKPQSGGTYCTAISVTAGRTYTITLVPATGNHYVG